MIITYDKIQINMKIILNYDLIKEGVIDDISFCWCNGNHLCICLEICIKACITLSEEYYIEGLTLIVSPFLYC